MACASGRNLPRRRGRGHRKKLIRRLIWSLGSGAGAGAVIAAALERGDPIPETLVPPPIGEVEAPFWDGFAALRAARAPEDSAPLSLAEILAWCDLAGLCDPVSRRDFHDVARALDQAWRARGFSVVSAGASGNLTATEHRTY